jgi:hypothetical protein
LANRIEQIEDRLSGKGDKVEELDQSIKDPEKMLRKYEWNMKNVWKTIKRPNL